jgi:hypothetical protein
MYQHMDESEDRDYGSTLYDIDIESSYCKGRNQSEQGTLEGARDKSNSTIQKRLPLLRCWPKKQEQYVSLCSKDYMCSSFVRSLRCVRAPHGLLQSIQVKTSLVELEKNRKLISIDPLYT